MSKVEEAIFLREGVEAEGVYYSSEFPFPYEPEQFSEEEKVILLRYFTNVDRPVYAIRDMDQEVAAALLSRFSRTKLAPRRLFLREFYGDPEEAIRMLQDYLAEGRGGGYEDATTEAERLYGKFLEMDDILKRRGKERKKEFFKSVFAEYGDDSVIQMGGIHLIFEDVSQPAAKAIEDQRVAAAYIEKSTRYVEFDRKVGDRFLYMDTPEIVGTGFEDEYHSWNNACFEAYVGAIPATKETLRQMYPLLDVVVVDKNTGEELKFAEIQDNEKKEQVRKAHETALRAKALDLVRAFLPSTTVTNIGVFFSGQTSENTINKMLTSPYKEVQLLGLMALEEAYKVIPSFLQNVPEKHGKTAREYLRDLRQNQEDVVDKWVDQIQPDRKGNKARLVDWDEDADVKIASQIIYTHQKRGLSKRAILEWAKRVKSEDLALNSDLGYSPTLARIIQEAVPKRDIKHRTRRQKLSRGFEHAFFEVEFTSNFGGFRDLQRNRISTTERQALSADEVETPREFYRQGMEEVLASYQRIASWTRDLHNRLVDSQDDSLKKAAEYVTILGNTIRYNVRANVRQWAFFSELRTIPGGHRDYRWIMQRAARQILFVAPYLKPLFANVDWKKDYGLGRLKAEIRTQEKLAQK
ncbi:FAD-dependent thymidylate synthase [Candidatus Woesebacteria bacterium]|nr:FAD-dependent thymidylate synthase [Candidatus Woesebacteria bacterium]